MKKVSIIIPIYNVAEYLPRCIESVLNQDNIDLEVLLINDGSTDSSGEVCEEYVKNDRRIRVFHQENSGVSAARNKGIEESSGDWLTFVDADDWIEPNSIKNIINKNKIDSDYIIARSFINRNGQAVIERYPFSNNLLNKSHKGSDLIIHSIYGRGSVCGVIYSKLFLKKNKIKFPVNLKNGEDSIFYTLCSIYGENISFSDIHFYNVYEREGSASRGNWTFDRVLNMTNNISYLNQYIEKHNKLTQEAISILNFAKYGVVSNLYNNFNNSFSIKNYFILRKEVKKKLDGSIDTGPIKTNKFKVNLLNVSLDAFAILVLLNNKLLR
ncbi:MAG TPA: glycosyltransferase family 2 protein [Gallicola sp.]|nr:glycosyltransferase family 2 protein [Gallicola sp.]